MRRMKTFAIIPILFLAFVAGTGHCEEPEQHSVFTELLNAHVREGEVDYKNLCQDKNLGLYIAQLSAADPEKLSSRKESLAFWINAYNAYTLKIICDHYPLKSINDLHTGGLIFGALIRQTVWHKKWVTINKERTSLDHIEHKIIRPVFKDPRIHFALVCAAKGCPPLRSEAYEAAALDAQLDDQARKFLSQKNQNHFDLRSKTARLSPLFSWFKKDFLSEADSVLEYLAPFTDQEIGASIKSDPQSWRIQYTDYDWSLNEP